MSNNYLNSKFICLRNSFSVMEMLPPKFLYKAPKPAALLSLVKPISINSLTMFVLQNKRKKTIKKRFKKRINLTNHYHLVL